MDPAPYCCGFVALVGYPNVGKSSLFNAWLGQKVSIVTPKPQTTRLAARGILTRPGWQAVLVDTPGLVGQADLLQSGMRETALTALKESDVILYLAAPDVRDSASLPPELLACLEKTVLLLNKVDAFKKGVWREFRSCLQTRASFRQVVEVSARTRFGLEELEQVLQPLLPEGPPLYQEDEITDQTPRQSAAEVIREKALFFVQEEVPHGLAVEIEEYQERPDGIHAIRATLYVERESQKGIVIGKSGEMLKKIGTAARLEMEKMFGARIFLTLWVKAVKNWKKDEAFLKRLGYPVGKMRREK